MHGFISSRVYVQIITNATYYVNFVNVQSPAEWNNGLTLTDKHGRKVSYKMKKSDTHIDQIQCLWLKKS